MSFAIRVGLGIGSDFVNPQDLLDAKAQLNSQIVSVGKRTLLKRNDAPEAWPSHLTFNLDERVEACRMDRKKREEIDENQSLSLKEKNKQRNDLRRLEHRFIDRLHLAHQSIYGHDPVRQRFIHFWANHFTVGASGPSPFFIGHLIQDIIAKGITGSFDQLAYDVTRHPSMLTYLDNVYSVGENSRYARDSGKNKQIGLNDNLARELMELHTTSPSIGYTETDIREAAKILSGWGDIFDNPKTIANFKKARITDFHMAYFKDKAEPGKKTVLGKTYKNGKDALKALVHDLSATENCGNFITKKLCVHFIADNPSKDDLNYVRAAWFDTNGHLPTVHHAVLDRAHITSQPKFQWPFTWFMTVLRTFQVNLIQGFDDLHQELLSIGGEYRIEHICREIGQDFWARRQPDGFSLQSEDWISPEHLDRRVRLAAMIHDHGKPKKIDQTALVEMLKLSQSTIDLIKKAKSSRDRFILLTCSKEFLGVAS